MKGGKGILSRLSILFWLQNKTFLTARSYILFLFIHAARNCAVICVRVCVMFLINCPLRYRDFSSCYTYLHRR